jgi:hypothetical protein
MFANRWLITRWKYTVRRAKSKPGLGKNARGTPFQPGGMAEICQRTCCGRASWSTGTEIDHFPQTALLIATVRLLPYRVVGVGGVVANMLADAPVLLDEEATDLKIIHSFRIQCVWCEIWDDLVTSWPEDLGISAYHHGLRMSRLHILVTSATKATILLMTSWPCDLRISGPSNRRISVPWNDLMASSSSWPQDLKPSWLPLA